MYFFYPCLPSIFLNSESTSLLMQFHNFFFQAQPGIKAQTFKMLELLPTRGPDAFQKFLKIIEPEYHWLAGKLKSDLEEVSKVPRELSMVATSINFQPSQSSSNDIKVQKDVEMAATATQNINQSVSRSASQTTEPGKMNCVYMVKFFF